MTRAEDKVYLQHVFDAIDQVYKMKKPQQTSSYEERLRASFNKLIIPDWYNHEYTSTNGLRKTKSHGHVPRVKRTNYITNNNDDDTPETSVSSSIASPYLSNGKHRQSYRHRSPSRSWSERPPLRHDSTTSSYDTNGSVINGRRSTTSNSPSSYASGVQRVAQSSTWYKPRIFATKTTNGNINGHPIEPPKPLPRYSKLVDQERIHSLDSSSSSSSSSSTSLPSKIENVRCPIKPRTMAQAQIPSEESFHNVTSDADVTLVPKSPTTQTTETSILRTNSIKSVSSEAESYRSAVLPPLDKNLLATDSSSYASVNERCLSPSTASYHTAVSDDTSLSSITGYETPTPQLDDDNNTISSSHSSLSDLSHAETLEPNTEDLDIAAVSTAEQKSDSGMEKSSNVDNSNWYDGSMETCIQQTVPNQIESLEIREIPNDEILREIDINAVGDEFFLFSPRNDETLNSINDKKEIIENSKHRFFTMEDKNLNDPFDFDSNNSTIMITNLDDILIDDNNNNNDYSSNNFLNINYRRPIQEDILYEVEHENSYSDHSQNTSSIIATDDKTSIKLDANIDYLTSTHSPVIDNIEQTSTEKQQPISTATTNDNNILPIYILPPLYTTTKLTSDEPSSSLHIDTNDNFQKLDSFINQFPDLTSPSYTSKIRHRHYSVGSYYDNKTTTVTIHPNHPYYFLGSAPVSPLNRTSSINNESHYHIRHQSPVTYDDISSNALRRVNPFFESNDDSKRSTDYRPSSLNREEKTRIITYISPKATSKPVERTIPITQTEPTSIIPQPITSPPSIRTSSVTFPQYEIPIHRSKPTNEIPITTIRRPLIENSSFIFEKSPTLPLRSSQLKQEPQPPPIVRPKVTRERVRTPPLSTRIEDQTQNIYQEIDSTSTDDDRTHTPNADLQFIRGAIERVFHFNGESTTDTTSESSIHYEEVDDNNQNQYPAIEAVQRFYNHKTFYPNQQQITNLDDVVISNSSTSKKSQNYSPPITSRKKHRSKSSEHERPSSEEIDDTLNDIEDVDYHDDKVKRQIIHNHSTHTSNENSPLNSSDTQSKTKKTSQETQTIERQKPIVRTIVPPIDIVTEIVIEQDDDNNNNNNNGQIDDADGDMVIFYDDIEIVEHSTSSCSSSESDSTSHHYSKPINTSIHKPPPPLPPPIPARTLKPTHLLNNNNSSTINKTYELEKNSIRKKFDVNSVNDMLNRTEYNIGPSVSHRHPSARHFVGKLNSDDSPTQPLATNEHKQSSIKPLVATLPIRSNSSNEKPRSIIADTNALVKQIQNSLSRNSLHDTQINSKKLSTSNKDLRSFVSSTYSPSDENTIDDNGMIHIRQQTNNNDDDQTFKRQARLSKSFHNVSEYNSTDQYPPKKETTTQPSKSVENNLHEFPQNPTKPLNLTSVVTSTSYSALPNSDDHARMLSLKWYTGKVSENSEICFNPHHIPGDDLLYGYISTHSNRETQALLARLQASNDARIHAALDDIRSRVAQFDTSKTRGDLQVFMRYLESRLKDLNNKKSTNGHQESDNISNSVSTNVNNKDIPSTRQLGRQHLRSAGNIGEGTNGQQPIPPRRASQSSSNQENPAVFDEMLNTVLGLPKKGVSALPQTFPSKREKPTPLIPTQITTNTSSGRDVGKRLFESGTYKDPRLIYDGPKRKEKEEQPLETSV